jgi:GNAT superfamily N-acetyltransferase
MSEPGWAGLENIMEKTSSTPQTQFHAKLLSGPVAREQFSALLDRCFPVKPGTHFLDDFPVWDEGVGPTKVIRIGLFEGPVLAASTGLRVVELQIGSGAVPVGIIGAVATDPSYRGKGLATHVVAAAVQQAEKVGAVAVFLWGSEHEMYQRLGFELCGEQVRAPLSALQLPPVGPPRPSTGWTPGIFRAMRARGSGLKFEESDARWLAAHKNVEWHWLGSAEAPTAYAGIGRGIDLSNMIHEWGGTTPALMSLLSHLRLTHPQVELLGSPTLLRDHGIETEAMEFLCMARVLNPAKLFATYFPGIPFKAERTAEGWMLTLEGACAEVSPGELTQVMLSRASGDLLPWGKYFPLRFWLWGLDGA